METFIHIGYPKCFSTTLQRGYFSIHPDINFGGIGIDSNIDFQNDALNLIFESAIPYYRNILFDKHADDFKSSIADFMNTGIKNRKQITGFSSEHLLFNFTPQGVDADIKLRRIHSLFGSNTILLIIVREQFSLIKSLYKEYVRVGYPYQFIDFLDWIYKYQDRNFYHEIMYGDIIKRAIEYFGRDSIKILFFEDYKSGGENVGQSLFEDVSDALNLEKINGNMDNHNPSLSDREVERKRILNAEIKHDLGKTMLEGFEDHRRRMFFNNYLKLKAPESVIFKDVLQKRTSLDLARESYSLHEPVSYKARASVVRRMKSEFSASNTLLERITGKDVVGKFIKTQTDTINSFTLIDD